ncbi:hypothetical protein CROQUDRAFT_95443 [Cronartium quercuum f. sp. fusiforme G11]|uniref:Uncharacterized protein n=1 Tax=Cronartium quercuum f. sp. fusiforme G11 TaxID=708437 RepID=A0A9P6NI90_9BASI|nr:hypothetical protein CROQUDRAFT_95443 [Cronartium quercuum f. sp. fusiforme G11]
MTVSKWSIQRLDHLNSCVWSDDSGRPILDRRKSRPSASSFNGDLRGPEIRRRTMDRMRWTGGVKIDPMEGELRKDSDGPAHELRVQSPRRADDDNIYKTYSAVANSSNVLFERLISPTFCATHAWL